MYKDRTGVRIMTSDGDVIVVCNDCYDYYAGGDVTNGEWHQAIHHDGYCDECGDYLRHGWPLTAEDIEERKADRAIHW